MDRPNARHEVQVGVAADFSLAYLATMGLYDKSLVSASRFSSFYQMPSLSLATSCMASGYN